MENWWFPDMIHLLCVVLWVYMLIRAVNKNWRNCVHEGLNISGATSETRWKKLIQNRAERQFAHFRMERSMAPATQWRLKSSLVHWRRRQHWEPWRSKGPHKECTISCGNVNSNARAENYGRTVFKHTGYWMISSRDTGEAQVVRSCDPANWVARKSDHWCSFVPRLMKAYAPCIMKKTFKAFLKQTIKPIHNHSDLLYIQGL